MKYDRPLTRFATFLLILISSSLIATAESPKQPNFIIIFIDDMGVKDWSGGGSDMLKTPAIDQIAKEGMVFTDGYANAANCAPSRCCLLSGQYTPRNHFYNVFTIHRGNKKTDRLSLNDVPDKQVLELDRTTFAEALKQVGYKTAMYGKWHVSKNKETPENQGFDDVLSHSARSLGKLFKQNKDPKQVYNYTGKAMEFAEQCSKESTPFCIYLAHHAVHLGYEFSDEAMQLYKDKPDGKINFNPKYGAMMHDTDKSIGQLMGKLKQLGIDDNTVVMLLSDNGGVPSHCTQPPLRAYKGAYFEGGIRVPFMVRWPGKVKAGENNTPVMAIDLYPTMLELAGVVDLNKHMGSHKLDGVSLKPLLTNAKLPERALYWHFPAYLKGNPKYPGGRDAERYRSKPVSVIRKGDWKLMMFFEEWSLDGGRKKMATNNSVELYNLKSDPGEKNNLAGKNSSKRDELLDELLLWQQQIKAPIPQATNSKLAKQNH